MGILAFHLVPINSNQGDRWLFSYVRRVRTCDLLIRERTVLGGICDEQLFVSRKLIFSTLDARLQKEVLQQASSIQYQVKNVLVNTYPTLSLPITAIAHARVNLSSPEALLCPQLALHSIATILAVPMSKVSAVFCRAWQSRMHPIWRTISSSS